MKNSLLLVLLLAAGCGTPPMRTINFDSDPPGAHVFMQMGPNEKSIGTADRSYLGTTPFSWTTEVNGDGSFKTSGSGIPFYSSFVQPVVIFTADPPSSATNLFEKKEVFHGNTDYQKGNAPQGVFFDLTKPN